MVWIGGQLAGWLAAWVQQEAVNGHFLPGCGRPPGRGLQCVKVLPQETAMGSVLFNTSVNVHSFLPVPRKRWRKELSKFTDDYKWGPNLSLIHI